MADDLVLSVRQIAQYPLATASAPTDRWLLQQGGIGGPYMSLDPETAVGTALQMGGTLHLAPGNVIAWNGAAFGFGIQAGPAEPPEPTFGFTEPVSVPSLFSLGPVFIDGVAAATVLQLDALAAIPKVDSFNGRTGIVQLNEDDIRRAGGTPVNNPHFTGLVFVPTPWDFRNDTEQAANCRWVQGVIEALLCSGSVVTSFNGRGGDIVLSADDISMAATFPGAMPRANNPPLGDASTRIATTMFVDDSLSDVEDRLTILINNQTDDALINYAPLNSPAFTGVPTAPTANAGNTTGQLATTAFVMNAVAAATAGVSSFNTRTGAVTLVTADITGAGGAPINAPSFTGIPLAPTATPATNTQQLATTAFVHSLLTATTMVSSFNTRTGAVVLNTADITGAGGAPLTSPALGGTPTAPTATAGTNTTQVATTAFVQAALAGVTGAVSSFNGRTGAITLIAADISAAGGALNASPALTGNPTAPTQPAGTNNTTLATTAFVLANAAAGGVSSFNGRTGAITLLTADITGAGGAPISSPAFTGVPTAPTAAQTVNDQTIATTAYVRAAIAAATGVASFNTRTGAVTLNATDITTAGGALTTGPAFTGVPTAPTAPLGTNSTQLATTAFVLANAGVTAFNCRTGAITLIGADLTSAGGALLASPTFSGTPNAPTPTTGTNNTQIATTAFVNAAITAAGGVTYKQSDTAPVPVTNFWFDSIGGQLYVNYVDPVSSAQSWVVANSPQPVVQPPQSGSKVLVTAFTVTTPVVNVNIFNGFDGTYDELELRAYDVQGAAENNLYIRFSGDGSTFDNATDYIYSDNYNAWNGTVNTTTGRGGTTTLIQLPSPPATTNEFYLITNIRRGPGGTANGRTGLLYRVGTNNSSGGVTAHGFAHWAMTGAPALQGLQLGISGPSNITRGTFKLYGIVK